MREVRLFTERRSLRASPQATLTALHSLELATASPALACLANPACGLAVGYRTSRMAHYQAPSIVDNWEH